MENLKDIARRNGFEITDDSAELKLRLKNLSPNQLASIGVVSLVAGKYDEIICPFCGNGAGDSRTGLNCMPTENGLQFHCFKCGNSFDNIDIFANHFNLDVKSDFAEILSRANDLTKIISTATPPPVDDKPKYSPEQIAQIKSDIIHFAAQIDELPEQDRRGITIDTYKHFHCGYSPNWTHIKAGNVPPSRRLIIPTSEVTYNAVLPKSDRNFLDKKYWKMNCGCKEIFNVTAIVKNTPVIVVEGEIDAMSIWQVTNSNVIALGGTGSYKKLLAFVDNIPADQRKDYLFVVVLDNDDAGKDASKLLTDGLIKCGCKAFSAVLAFSADKVDANDLLLAGQDLLKNRIEQILAEAKLEFEKPVDNDSDKKRKPTTAQAIQSCPIDLQVPVSYIFDEVGIIFNGDKKLSGLICNTPVVITKKLRDVDTGNVFSEIAFYDKFNHHWIYKIVPDKTLSDYRVISELTNYGISFAQEYAKPLSKYFVNLPFIPHNLKIIPCHSLYNFTGWTDDSFTKFILPDHLQDNEVLYDPKGIYKNKFVQKGDFDSWKKAIMQLATHPEMSAAFFIIFGAALSTPLYQILRLRNAQYLLWCQSGSGKSAMAKIAMSIYGDPTELKNTFNGTTFSISDLPKYFNCLPILIDEFQSASKAIREDIANVIYNFSEGKTRNRLSRDGSGNAIKTFYSTRIMTAEQPIITSATDAGAFNRLLSISTDKLFPAGTNIAEIHRFFDANHGFFGSVWIEHIMQNINDIKHKFIVNQRFFEDLEKGFGWTNGWKDHIAVILTALQSALPLIGDVNMYEVHDLFMRDFASIDEEIPRKATITNKQRALRLLEDYVNSHPRYFKHEHYYSTENENQMVNAEDGVAFELKGYLFKDGSVGFIPSALTNILQNELGFSSAQAILRGWLDDKLIVKPNGDSHKYSIIKKIKEGDSRKSIRLICFEKNVLCCVPEEE